MLCDIEATHWPVFTPPREELASAFQHPGTSHHITVMLRLLVKVTRPNFKTVRAFAEDTLEVLEDRFKSSFCFSMPSAWEEVQEGKEVWAVNTGGWKGSGGSSPGLDVVQRGQGRRSSVPLYPLLLDIHTRLTHYALSIVDRPRPPLTQLCYHEEDDGGRFRLGSADWRTVLPTKLSGCCSLSLDPPSLDA